MSAIVRPNDGRIVLPNNWAARPHQTPFMEAMYGGTKRAVCVWHRRAGKDSASLNFTAVEAHRKIANYWHMLPTAIQGRHVVWDSVNPQTGQRVIDQVFPPEIREATNNTEMKIELSCGSTWQVVGSDNYDRLVGSNPYGVIFSEYSIADPRAWDFIRPILAENGGWAIFIYTSRGKNHGHDLYQMAQNNPNWFCELLDIEHSYRDEAQTEPVISVAQYEEEIAAGMDRQLALQEFYCSFDAGLFGAFYTDQMKLAEFGNFGYNPRKPVHTFWDLGLRDATTIWFGQQNGNYIDIIDYMEESNVSLTQWCKRINELPYNYGSHTAPHDIKRRDYKDAVSHLESAAELGVHFEVCPSLSLREGIDATKTFIPRCRFNTGDTGKPVSQGVDALYNYRREYNDKLRVFMDRPLHDWASHGADAFRMMAIAWNDRFEERSNRRFRVIGASAETRKRVSKRPNMNQQQKTPWGY